MNSKVAVTGIQPSGQLHIGNYFGAVKQAVDLQANYDLRIFVVDYHAMTTIHDAEVLRANTKNIILDFMALGIDPRECTLYRQSDVLELTEMAWIFSTLPTITVPYLERAHAFKDKVAKGVDATAGLFFYPVLMAADVLIHDADIVPVGKDQAQHLEIARDIVRAFNKNYGDTFTEPKALILDEIATVPGLDGEKMSKSKGNVIPIFATAEETKELVMKIPTDSKTPDEPKNTDSTLFQIHSLFLDKEEKTRLQKFYEEGGVGYKELKEMLAEAINTHFKPMRAMRQELAGDEKLVDDIIKMGAGKMREVASAKMQAVRVNCGLR